MNNKEKFNWILAILLGVVISILVYKFVMNNVEMTTQDIMDRIEEVPAAQDKGLIFDEELIIVENR
jgi:vancomycin permeability regulator SanA|tara:strand:- start:2539 stop:2736 length:198 start_codon:yes stop_codon:yes gene_type:complete